MNWANKLIEEYYNFLKENTIITETSKSEWVEISTPFVGLFNDTLDIFIKKAGDKIILSDDGETIRNLELSGVDITKSKKRKELLQKILINYSVELKHKELITIATEKNFPQKKLNLLSAIMEINDLYVLAKHTVASIFREDVKEFLDEQKIIYTPFFIARGKSGLEFTFDFQIAYRKKEIVIKSFNSVNTSNLSHFLFGWEDVKTIREQQIDKKITALAVINDKDKTVKKEYLEALNKYEAEYILWSERHKPENIQKLKEAI